jgi:hypothetical protein
MASRGTPRRFLPIDVREPPYRCAMTDRTSGLQAISPAMMARMAATSETSPSF